VFGSCGARVTCWLPSSGSPSPLRATSPSPSTCRLGYRRWLLVFLSVVAVVAGLCVPARALCRSGSGLYAPQGVGGGLVRVVRSCGSACVQGGRIPWRQSLSYSLTVALSPLLAASCVLSPLGGCRCFCAIAVKVFSFGCLCPSFVAAACGAVYSGVTHVAVSGWARGGMAAYVASGDYTGGPTGAFQGVPMGATVGGFGSTV